MKKVFLFVALIATLALPKVVMAQNVQVLYDFGHNIYEDGKAPSATPALLTTVEHFKPDSFGSTFFFIDMTYKDSGIQSAYWEVQQLLPTWCDLFLQC